MQWTTQGKNRQPGMKKRYFFPFRNREKTLIEQVADQKDFISWMKERVNSVFDMLEGRLFDYDSGIMGYLLSFPGGTIPSGRRSRAVWQPERTGKSLRAIVWPEEKLFQSAKDREDKQKIAECILAFAQQ